MNNNNCLEHSEPMDPTKAGRFQICPFHPEKEKAEEALIAICELKNVLYMGYLKVCNAHVEEAIKNPNKLFYEE